MILLNKYYCIKCRRKLEHNSATNWYPDLSKEVTKQLYANFSAWICKECNIAFIFLNSSGNKNTILTIIHLEDYIEKEGT